MCASEHQLLWPEYLLSLVWEVVYWRWRRPTYFNDAYCAANTVPLANLSCDHSNLWGTVPAAELAGFRAREWWRKTVRGWLTGSYHISGGIGWVGWQRKGRGEGKNGREGGERGRGQLSFPIQTVLWLMYHHLQLRRHVHRKPPTAYLWHAHDARVESLSKWCSIPANMHTRKRIDFVGGRVRQ